MSLAERLDDARKDWRSTVLEAARSVLESRALGGLSEEKRDAVRAELQTLLEIVSEVHEPRVAVLGDDSYDVVPLLAELLSGELPGEASVKAEIGAGRWYEWQTTAGNLQLLDARTDAEFKAFRWGLPDLVLQQVPVRPGDGEIEAIVERFVEVDDALRTYGGMAALVAAILPPSRGADDLLAMRVRDRLVEAADVAGVAIHVTIARLPGELAEEIAPLLPQGARFPWARLTPASKAQQKVADRVIGIASSINATIASVPLPLAATLPITTIQILMIATIAWVSGRERSLRTVGEFLAAAGLNIGASYALRELARALVGFVPVAGQVVSAGIAASATVAVGEAAKRYFLNNG